MTTKRHLEKIAEIIKGNAPNETKHKIRSRRITFAELC
jgi:hypothetical protein